MSYVFRGNYQTLIISSCLHPFKFQRHHYIDNSFGIYLGWATDKKWKALQMADKMEKEEENAHRGGLF